MRLFLFITLLLSCYLNAQNIGLNEIMKGQDFIGHWPEQVKWYTEPNTILFEQQKNEDSISRLYAYNTLRQEHRLAKQEEYRFFYAQSKHYFPINDLKGGANQGLIYLYDNTFYLKDQLALPDQQLISWSQNISYFEPISDHEFIFQSNQSLYHLQLYPFAIKCILKVQNDPPKAQNANVWGDEAPAFVNSLVKEKEQKELQKAYQKQMQASMNYYSLAADEELKRLFKVPGQDYYLILTSKKSTSLPTQMMNYVNLEGVAQPYAARPKVGAMPLQEDYLYLYHSDTLVRKITFKDTPKEAYIHLHRYQNQLKEIPVEFKSSDNHHRHIGLINLNTGKTSTVDHQHDTAWIGGPGISGWNMEPGNVGWRDETLYYQSEVSGYSHLYEYRKGKSKALTQGEFEVRRASWDENQQAYQLRLNKIHPGVRNTYLLKDNKLIPVSEGYFGIEEAISPNQQSKWIKISHRLTPPAIYWIKDNDTISVNFPYLSKDYQEFATHTPQIVSISPQGCQSRIYQPKAANGKGIIFVHGAGYLQNAHYYWSGYYREMLFHQLLIKEGYTVLDPDYTASDGYGRNWRTGIYLHMGGEDLADILHARNYLIKQGIKEGSIGVYGGSYGGFMTLSALFKHPGKFAAGAALRSVTDWAHYNDPYTSNILGLPQEQPEAYRKSSPIYFAHQLQDPLLMCHGLMDDNVQVQDIFRLSQYLIELKKENWELALYPIEPHGFRTATSWLDEYRRVYQLFKRNL